MVQVCKFFRYFSGFLLLPNFLLHKPKGEPNEGTRVNTNCTWEVVPSSKFVQIVLKSLWNSQNSFKQGLTTQKENTKITGLAINIPRDSIANYFNADFSDLFWCKNVSAHKFRTKFWLYLGSTCSFAFASAVFRSCLLRIRSHFQISGLILK